MNPEGEPVEATVYQPDGEGGASSSVWASGTLTRIDDDYHLGDMVFPAWLVEELRQRGDDGIGSTEQAVFAWTEPRYLWPGGVVHYVVDPDVPDQARIREAIAEWEAKTPLRFVQRSNEADFIRFDHVSDGCRAHVGRIGGEQTVWIAPECGTRAVLHEIGHAIGLWHEHTRPDRDEHVRVYFDNIDPANRAPFEIVQTATAVGPYDTNSVMHYHSYAFSNNDRPTILRRDGSEIRYEGLLSKHDATYTTAIYGGFDGTFADDDGNVHEAQIEKIAEANITAGCGQSFPPLFCPDRKVTRAEMAVFLTRAMNLPAASADYFDDDDGQWYEAAANSIAEAGVTRGCSERKYCPVDSITRAQMAAFLSRALNLPATNVDYFDDDNDTWYEGVANRMYEAGVTKGCATRTYCGDEPVLRDQMASFLARAFL